LNKIGRLPFVHFSAPADRVVVRFTAGLPFQDLVKLATPVPDYE